MAPPPVDPDYRGSVKDMGEATPATRSQAATGGASNGPVVVGLLTHRDPDSVRRLVDRILEGERTVVLVHHDPRGPALRLPSDERVIRMPNAQAANWGGMGVARAQLRVVRSAVEHVPDLSWIVLASGQDYPLRNLRSIEAELASTSEDAFVRNFCASGDPSDDVHPWQALTRRRYLRRRVLPGTHRSIPSIRRHPFDEDTALWVGDLWVNLGSRAAHHVIEQEHRRPDLVRYFSTTSIPDEALLPTLLLNNAPDLRVVSDHRRHIEWTSGGRHPDVLTTSHLPQLTASTAFFGRKFDPAVDAAVLDALDEHAVGGRA